MNAAADGAGPSTLTPSLDSTDSETARQLDLDLSTIYNERQEIIAAISNPCSPELALLNDDLRKRLQAAADLRDYKLANLRANFDVECQQAWNDFQRGKKELRTDILNVAVDRRRRIDSVRASAVAKKKKRRSSAGGERNAKRLRFDTNRAFLSSLEKQGMLRVAATPDEVNNDLAVILHGMDSARANGHSRPPVERPQDLSVRAVDKIHSSRGILHYHEITYEKGDRVAMFSQVRPNGGQRSHKYSGVILAVNSKEIHIKTDDGASHRVYVAHLRNGRFAMKPATDVAAS